MSTYSEFPATEKVSITLLSFPESEVQTYTINDQEILVHSLIPYETLFAALQETITGIVGEYGYISGGKYQVVSEIIILKYFTNLDLTLFDSETGAFEIYSTYDILKPHFKYITDLINAEQLQFFYDTLEKTVQYIVTFRNSIAGILDSLKDQTESLNQDQDNLVEKIQDPNFLKTLKSIVETSSPATADAS
jgi:hypothetical protein